ncbi:M20 family metallopeptidase [Nocardioides sp. BYT-33-1]|uniref:M20 family metallopeptidase n=1 Tax=Nocardioides sp. BYT-33-1 TaxID=3416952 RepID=UPI003F53E043
MIDLTDRDVTRIRDAVDVLSAPLTELLVRAVRCPSVTGGEGEVAVLMHEWMTARGWTPTLVTVEPTAGHDRANVVVRRGAADGPLLVLNGHLDVVPPGPADAWTRSPYSGQVVDGRIHGRGTVDMKGGIVAGIGALLALESAGIELAHRIELQLVVGEETTGVGTREAVRALDLTEVAGAIVLEPTCGRIVTVNTGLQFFDVRVSGRAAHSSAPWEGVDAFAKLLLVREAMQAEAQRRSARYRHPLLAGVPDPMPFVVGEVSAGTYRAAVPAHARMTGRYGLQPGESVREARAAFAAAIDEVADRDPWLRDHRPELVWDHMGLPGWDTDQDSDVVRALVRARELTTGSAELTGFTAGSDAAVYGAALVPTVVFGPGDVALAHAPDESVAMVDVLDCAKTLALALAGLA